MTRYLLAFAGLAAAAAFFVSAAHAAPTGFFFPGGAREDSVMHAPGSTLDGLSVTQWGMAIDANATAAAQAQALANTANAGVSTNADAISSEAERAKLAEATNASSAAAAQELAGAAIPKTQIDVAAGVAGLDANGNMTAPVTSGPDWIGNWQKTYPNVDSYAWGYESALFGGQTSTGEGNNTFNPRSVFVQSDPYGPYSAGCATGVAMTGSEYSAQFPVSEVEPKDGAASVKAVGGFDTVANCTLISNFPARFIFKVVGYTANTVELAEPLTAAQAARIYPNMYITTNSPNPALTGTAVDGELPQKNLYAGFVKDTPAAGSTTIDVYAWDVPTLGTGAANQVPQTTTLDTVWSAYPTPVVFLGGGAAGSIFGNNWFFNIDANSLAATSSTTSLAHQVTPLEVDLNIVNGTAPAHSLWYQGFSMSGGNQPQAFTTDSREFLFGGNIPHHVQFDGGSGNWLIDGDNVFIPSTKTESINSGNPAKLYQEWDQWVSSTSNMRFILWNAFGNPTASTGWEQAVVHLGPTVDGNPTPTGDPGGSKQADLEWNVAGNYGSLSICGYASACGFRVNGDGTSLFNGTAALMNNMQFIFYSPTPGQGSPILHSTAADTLSETTDDGGVAHFNAGAINLSSLTGTGNAYACLDASGNLYRSATACD
ncbi:hypothetical protein [Gluconobacter oxydans]|uniref:hypothetical protein n=1 Tax=Gluconobacter oxydans TaxID=442 RepID=UPI0039E810DE